MDREERSDEWSFMFRPRISDTTFNQKYELIKKIVIIICIYSSTAHNTQIISWYPYLLVCWTLVCFSTLFKGFGKCVWILQNFWYQLDYKLLATDIHYFNLVLVRDKIWIKNIWIDQRASHYFAWYLIEPSCFQWWGSVGSTYPGWNVEHGSPN